MNKISCALLAWSMAWGCLAQTPAAPLFQFPTGDAAWTVALTYRGGAEKSASRIDKSEVTVAGNYRRSVFAWSDGKITETWRFKDTGFEAVQNPANGEVYIIRPHDDPLFTAKLVVNLDVTCFDWVTADMLKDNPTYLKKKCLHYQGMFSPGMTLRTDNGVTSLVPLPKVPYHAWIDQETLLPVAFDNSQRIAVFTFHAPSAEPLVMPPIFKNELARFKKALELPKPYKSSQR